MIGAAPADGEQYVQKDGGWSLLDAGGGSQWDDVSGGIEYSGGDITATSSFRYGTNLHLANTSTGGTSWSINSSGQDSVLGVGNLELSVTSQGPKAVLKANGDFTASKFIGDGSQLTNLPAGSQWDDVTGGINYADGNVGINYDSPNAQLHIRHSEVAGSTYASTDVLAIERQRADNQISFYSDQAICTSAGFYFKDNVRAFEGGIFYDHVNRLMRFRESNADQMYLNGGRLGIGTENPDVKLTLDDGVDAGNNSSTRMLGFGGGGTNSNPAYITRVRGNLSSEIGLGFDVRNNASGLFEAMRIDSSGNVQISTGNLELSNGGGWFQSDATWVRSLNNKGVFNASTAATAFATPGDFTAGYSDMRLKTHLGTIPDALDKVCSLEGFYYERNDTAVELGYTGGERRVGLSAQDVQAVLPEVVKDAPINIDHGTDYLTIDYERVVPLLVESIKDLRAEIAALRSELRGKA
jgi:hypothetical protein